MKERGKLENNTVVTTVMSNLDYTKHSMRQGLIMQRLQSETNMYTNI